jgi:putative salt-induced outer membrane protein
MKKQICILISCGGLFFAASSNAQEWSGQGEAGLLKSSGNTDSENFNVGLAFKKEGDLWSHDVGFKYFKNSSDGVDSADSLSADYTAKRTLTERRYLFAGLSYLDDSFDGFTEQASVSFGYGYKVFDTEPLGWDVGIGVGYRDTSELIKLDGGIEQEGKDLSGATLVLLSDYHNQLTSNTKFTDNFRAELSSDNSFIENDAALIVSMNEKFALKAGLLIRHNTDPAPGADDTDTITSFNLLYNF